MAIREAGPVSPEQVLRTAELVGTPCYLYDVSHIIARCRAMLAMPHAFGLEVRYAMKANPGRAVLELISAQGLGLDTSSLGEVRRAQRAGIAPDRMMLTSQDVPPAQEREELESLLAQGLVYNACSLRQLELVAGLRGIRPRQLSLRLNPGVGTGESATRNTGDQYSSFGIHRSALDEARQLMRARGLVARQIHTHIGSGGDPELWKDNIDRVLSLVEEHFPEAEVVNFGGGFREARMPDERAADLQALGEHARQRLLDFARRTGRRLMMAVEPGTYLVANAGYLIARVIDKKCSGPEGFHFLVLDAGMESSTRPLLYGSRHPFYVVSAQGELLSSEFELEQARGRLRPQVVVGRCCESGDCQTLDPEGRVVPRLMAEPEVGDLVVIGGAGAYCSAMCLLHYNSYPAPPEVMLLPDGKLVVTRRRETLDQMVANELGLEGEWQPRPGASQSQTDTHSRQSA